MRGIRILLPASAAALLALLAAPYAFSQGMGAEDSQANEQQTRRTPAMRERVYTRLAEAQECAEMDDIECAQQRLAQVREMDDSTATKLRRCGISTRSSTLDKTTTGSHPGLRNGVAAARTAPGHGNDDHVHLVPVVFSAGTLRRLAGNAESLVRPLRGSRGGALRTEGADSLFPAAVSGRYRAGGNGIRINEELERAPQENWYRLLNVFYYELEDYANVIEVLRTMVEMWPKREYFVQLSAMYGQEGEENAQLALLRSGP